MSKDGRTDSYTYDAEGIRTSKVTTETDGKKKTSKAVKNNSNWWSKASKKATPALKKAGSSLKSMFIGDTKSEIILICYIRIIGKRGDMCVVL